MAQLVVDAVAYILERTDTVTTMRLQELAFYSRAQHLAQYGSSSSPKDFEAWRGESTAPEPYALHRGMFLTHPDKLVPDGSSALTDVKRTLVDSVCSALDDTTGIELNEQIYLGSLWLDAREELAPSVPSNMVIT